MRILFYISTIRGGGAARVMVNIANEMHVAGNEICFVTNFPADHEYALKEGIKRISLEYVENKGGTIQKNVSRIRSLRKVIVAERPDVCISFMRENNFRLLFASKGLKTKTIVSVRNDPEKEYPSTFSKMLAKILYRKADCVVFQAEDAKAFFPISVQKNARIIFNQVDEKFFCENDVDGDYIVACGRLSKQKNYSMMIMAFATVLQKYPDEVLRIDGEGDLKTELQNLTVELGIQDSVKFMGFSTDMVAAYSRAKFFVMTSDYEGMPNALLEALASSVPVISTDCPCGGPRMIIRNGENGFLIPVDDKDALAEKMVELLKVDRHTFKQSAHNSAETYSPIHVFDQWMDAVKSV